MEGKITDKIKNVIVVLSGKGGVGKSTVAVNIATTLATKGHSVGLLDADIYGPSVPMMFGVEKVDAEKNFYVDADGKEVFLPIEKYGVKINSIGFYVNTSEALVWRGPMAASVFTQLLTQTEWGNLDYLIIDAPPGTGDIQLSLVQTVGVTGAVVVTTPQEVACVEAMKAVTMLRKDEIKVPVLGIVENMSWFTPLAHPDEKYFLFGKEGGKTLAQEVHVALLGQVPLIEGVTDNADKGLPAVASENHVYSETFDKITDKMIEMVDVRNQVLKPTEKVKIDPEAGCSLN